MDRFHAIKNHLNKTILTVVGKKVTSSEKIIHVFANDIEFNYVPGETLLNGSGNPSKKEKSINKFRSIEEDSCNEQSSIKTNRQ